MVLLGMVDRNGMICSTHGECLALRSRKKVVLATSDYLTALTNHCDA